MGNKQPEPPPPPPEQYTYGTPGKPRPPRPQVQGGKVGERRFIGRLEPEIERPFQPGDAGGPKYDPKVDNPYHNLLQTKPSHMADYYGQSDRVKLTSDKMVYSAVDKLVDFTPPADPNTIVCFLKYFVFHLNSNYNLLKYRQVRVHVGIVLKFTLNECQTKKILLISVPLSNSFFNKYISIN